MLQEMQIGPLERIMQRAQLLEDLQICDKSNHASFSSASRSSMQLFSWLSRLVRNIHIQFLQRLDQAKTLHLFSVFESESKKGCLHAI